VLGFEIESSTEDELLAGELWQAPAEGSGQALVRAQALGSLATVVVRGDLDHRVEAAGGDHDPPSVAESSGERPVAADLSDVRVGDRGAMSAKDPVQSPHGALDLGREPSSVAAHRPEPLGRGLVADEGLGTGDRHPTRGDGAGLGLPWRCAPLAPPAEQMSLRGAERLEDEDALGGRVRAGADQVAAILGPEDKAVLELYCRKRSAPGLRLGGRLRATRRGGLRPSAPRLTAASTSTDGRFQERLIRALTSTAAR